MLKAFLIFIAFIITHQSSLANDFIAINSIDDLRTYQVW